MSGRPEMILVAAVAENGAIGQAGAMPWRLPSDLRHFKAVTLGRPVVMGRKTFVSIGRPLPGRANIVVSRDAGFAPAGAETVADLDAALDLAARRAVEAGVDGYAVIGGGAVYAAAIGRADRLVLTRVAAAPAADTFFPAVDPQVFRLLTREPLARDPRDSADATVEVWVRKGPAGAIV